MTLLFQTGCKSEAFRIRQKVFVEEQGFKLEFDEIDDMESTIHIAAFLDGTLIGCSRVFPDPADPNVWIFGRMAVLPQYRGKGFGSEILRRSEKVAQENGASIIRLHAQCRAMPFYEKLGYEAYGKVEMDEHVEHIWMKRRL